MRKTEKKWKINSKRFEYKVVEFIQYTKPRITNTTLKDHKDQRNLWLNTVTMNNKNSLSQLICMCMLLTNVYICTCIDTHTYIYICTMHSNIWFYEHQQQRMGNRKYSRVAITATTMAGYTGIKIENVQGNQESLEYSIHIFYIYIYSTHI